MKRVLPCLWLLAGPCLGQTTIEVKQMRQILRNLAAGRPQAERQIAWDRLQIWKARDLPEYAQLDKNQKAAFRRAVLSKLRPKLDHWTAGCRGKQLILQRQDLQFRFEHEPGGLKLTEIR